MMKLKIIVPKNSSDKWIVNNQYRRATPHTVLALMERLLLKATTKEKTYVSVKYDGGYHNESQPSSNVNEQLWTTACFLEDYLTQRIFNQYERRYLKSGMVVI